MKYGNALIAVGIINFLVVFSGLPTGWKQAVVVATSTVLVLVGWISRTVARRRAQRIREATEALEPLMDPEIEDVAEEIARDVADQVEYDLHSLSEPETAEEPDRGDAEDRESRFADETLD